MTFLLNGKPVDALALIVHRSAQDLVGRHWVKKLRTSNHELEGYPQLTTIEQTKSSPDSFSKFLFKQPLERRLLPERP